MPSIARVTVFSTACLLMLSSSRAQRTVLNAADETLGTNAIMTLAFTASGATFTVGQNFRTADPWPRVTLTRYVAFFDYEHASIRQELMREMGGAMPKGGGVPFTGGLRQIQLAINVAADITPPAEATSAAVPPAIVTSQQVADGVFWLTGGTHHSLAIAMRDHVVLVDAPNGEPRVAAVIAKTKELIPGKPIRYVVATHHHWDHLGGIRTAIDEGATIVARRSNRPFLERAATAPHTIAPDRLSMSKKPLKLRPVDAEGSLTDGIRIVKLYAMTDFDHTAKMLLSICRRRSCWQKPMRTRRQTRRRCR